MILIGENLKVLAENSFLTGKQPGNGKTVCITRCLIHALHSVPKHSIQRLIEVLYKKRFTSNVTTSVGGIHI
jgi:hypothetical protein